MSYAARIVDGVVTEVIVGSGEWADAQLDGDWRGSTTRVGIGWTWTAADGFRPPQPYASWSWVDGAWSPPTPMPAEGRWDWDEASLAWAPIIR